MSEEQGTSEVFFNREDRFTSSNVGQVAKSGESQLLLELLQSGRPADISDNRGWFPIHEAANAGHSSCLTVLLKYCKRDFKNTKTYNGETPLFLAALHGHAQAMEILLHHGADINISNNEMISVLVAAVKGRNTECIQICIDHKVNLDSQDAGGWSALHEAAFLGEIDCLRLLVSSGANINIQNTDGSTPLFVAAQYGNTECLKFLIQNKGEINLGTIDKATPLFIASQEGYNDCVKALIDAGADVKLKTTDSSTPLHAAAELSQFDCIKLLLKAGADVNAKCIENRNLTPLHLSVFNDSVECLIELIDCGACITAEVSESLETPLELAVSLGAVKCCEELIKRGCDPNRSYYKNFLEETTLLCAIDGKESECLEILLRYGADPNKQFYTYPIIAAAKNFDPKCLRILIKYGADVDIQDRGQNTALNLSVTILYHRLSTDESIETQLECIKILLKAGSDVGVLFKGPHGVFSQPPFTQKLISPELIKLLLLFGANTPQMMQLVMCDYCYGDKSKFNELRREFKTPIKLVSLCRLVIRKRLGKKRITRISELPVPVILQKFLDFHDL